MNKIQKTYIILFLLGLSLSAINPKEYFTWFLEVVPALIGFIILLLTHKKFTFTNFTYGFILLHCIILFIGGHYTYAQVPLFHWLKETLHQSRNNYDKVGHFAQGFVPAMIVRELLIRKNVIAQKGWLPFIVVAICLAISAAYEWIEWGVSVCTGDGGDAFLGTQGYVWDTQSDMLFATVGAVVMVMYFSKLQDKAMDDQLIIDN
jgi:putative membrane protein